MLISTISVGVVVRASPSTLATQVCFLGLASIAVYVCRDDLYSCMGLFFSSFQRHRTTIKPKGLVSIKIVIG